MHTPKSGQGSPLKELDGLLLRFEDRLRRAKEAYIEAIRPRPEDPNKSKLLKNSFFDNLRRFAAPTSSPTATPNSSYHHFHDDSDHSHPPFGAGSAKRKAKFIYIPEEESFIEDLRRIAELVVIGENYVTSLEKKVQKEMEKSRQKWSLDRDLIDTCEDEPPSEERLPQSPDFADVFDFFFERNTLATLVDLLTGNVFGPREIEDMVRQAEEKEIQETFSENRAPPVATTPRVSTPRNIVEKHILIPPMAIATQAVQSISILVQNVSRATSLYILFSNDHVNNMINLNLDLYEQAERERRIASGEKNVGSIHSSAEVAEFTTHFITFLKSLALRMNVETLQFFLQYPEEVGATVSSPHLSDQNKKNERQAINRLLVEGHDPSSLRVNFPLYDRALDFCAAHHDSFVRVTAMNICLNTIRLTTVSDPPPPPANEDLDEMEGAFGSAVLPSSAKARSSSTPDVALHNAQALPFRERLAIAQHTCTPSRVERLISPIFTKLSERWTSLDESIRDMDEYDRNVRHGSGGIRSEKVARVKEKVKREKHVNTFKDRAADLQDELLLLEDVFKVGLTVLNEQMIEMMMATFIYPLLLQPLILFSQRYTAVVLEREQSIPTSHSTFDHPFGAAFAGDYKDAQAHLARVTGPAKTALFTMSAAFDFLSNPPLLRLMFTALLHPISPDSSTVPTVRSQLQVASVDVYGRGTIRVDDLYEEGEVVSDSRISYPFGTNEINRRLSTHRVPLSDDSERSTDEEPCVFVLAPALAEVLEYRGQNYDLIARTRPNSYRQALFQCIGMQTAEFDQIRALAVCAFDAALSKLDPKLATDLLYGVNLKTFADDIPMDERNLDTTYAHAEFDRGLGGSAKLESRHTINLRQGVFGTNLVGQVVSPLASAILHCKRGWNKEWKLRYDGLAAHSIILASKGNISGLVAASKALETRRNQAAQFLAQLPRLLHSQTGGSPASYFLVGVPHGSAADYDHQMYGAVMNAIIFGVMAGDKDAPIEKLLELQMRSSNGIDEGFSVEISSTGGFNATVDSIGNSFLAELEAPETKQRSITRDFVELRESVSVFFQADALLSLLKDLAATGGFALRNVKAEGIALSKEGTFVQTMDWKYSKKIFAPISSRFADCLLFSGGSSVSSGTILKLAGFPAIPCVCEAPASLSHLFASQGSGIVAQGVTWQSLYLVFKDGWMIFAQPIPGGARGEGRVIGACLLEKTYVDKDNGPVDIGSPARRLLFAHASFDPIPPPLFLYDEFPEKDTNLPLAKVCSYVSHLDVWCENERSVDYAYQVASSQIFCAKAKRGRRVQAFLSPEKLN